MKLTDYRDTAIIGGSAIIGSALAILAWDELRGAWIRKESVTPATRAAMFAAVPDGVNWNLYRVGADYDGAPKGTYVRPASEREAKSSEAAEKLDDAGVFAVIESGEHVLPGTTEWDELIAPRAHGAATVVTYYRVG